MCGSLDDASAVRDDLRAALSGAPVDDLVLGAASIVVVASSQETLGQVVPIVARVAGQSGAASMAGRKGWAGDGAPVVAPDETLVEIPVEYDGEDLDEVARMTGMTVPEVVAAHTGTPWRVGFAGFAPGFAYLVGGDPRLRVPRRSSPRVRVPAGAVALADEYSGVYPRASPGGWQIIGSTDAPMWDLDRRPASLLTPGQTVRFVARTDPREPGPPTRDPDSPAASRPQDRPLPTGRRWLEVVRTARDVLLQDLGRPGHADLGAGPSGAADRGAYLLGARLLGQGPESAAMEVLLGEVEVRAGAGVTVALTGAPAPARIGAHPAPHAAAFLLPAGETLTLGRPAYGLRTYLSVRGGFVVDAVLGSRSRDTLGALGPEPLRTGDVAPVGWSVRWPTVDLAPVAGPPPPERGVPPTVRLAATSGPYAHLLGAPGLRAVEWSVSAHSDRVGLRLDPVDDGARPVAAGTAEVPPIGLVRGAVQLSPDGRLTVFLSDHPVTGGYPVVAVLDERACDLAAQLRPGSLVTLDLTSSSPR